MKIIYEIKRPMSQIRKDPSSSSAIIQILGPDGRFYTGTALHNGWIFIEEIKGWAEIADLYCVEVIEPIEPDADVDFSTDENKDTSNDYDAQKIMTAIIGSPYTFPSTKIIHREGNVETNLGTTLATLNNTLDAMRDIIDKVEDIPALPRIPDVITNGAMMIMDENGNISWKKIDYANIENTPDSNSLLGTQDF